MNKDTFQGKWTQFKGELKRQWGKFTDDDLMQIEGTTTSSWAKYRNTMASKKTPS